MKINWVNIVSSIIMLLSIGLLAETITQPFLKTSFIKSGISIVLLVSSTVCFLESNKIIKTRNKMEIIIEMIFLIFSPLIMWGIYYFNDSLIEETFQGYLIASLIISSIFGYSLYKIIVRYTKIR
jgi:hypothetical protein